MADLKDAYIRLQPQGEVRIQANSPLHRGTYTCRLLEIGDNSARISMPMENGRLVFLPTGTSIQVEVDYEGNVLSFDSIVLERRTGQESALVIAPPTCAGSQEQKREKPPLFTQAKLIGVTSGKGGVGKTILSINLGVALARLGKKVCIVDGDFGMANIDVLLNLHPKFNLSHVLSGEKELTDVLATGPGGVKIFPGVSGLRSLTDLRDYQFRRLWEQLAQLDTQLDYIIVDTAAGIGHNMLNLMEAVDYGLLVTTPEPHAITDVYALIKILSGSAFQGQLSLIINMVANGKEGQEVADKIMFAARRFLDYNLTYLGCIPDDTYVTRAIRRQVDLISQYPNSRASTSINQLALSLSNSQWQQTRHSGGLRGFLGRMGTFLGLTAD